MQLQLVETLGPDFAVLRDPVGGRSQAVHLDMTGPALTLASTRDETGAFEHLDVFGHGLEADRERLGQLVHRAVAVGEAGEDGAARTVGQRGEHHVEVVVGGSRHTAIQLTSLSTVKLNNERN